MNFRDTAYIADIEGEDKYQAALKRETNLFRKEFCRYYGFQDSSLNVEVSDPGDGTLAFDVKFDDFTVMCCPWAENIVVTHIGGKEIRIEDPEAEPTGVADLLLRQYSEILKLRAMQ